MSDICGRRRLAKLVFVTGASGKLRGFLEEPKLDNPNNFRLTDPFVFHAALLEAPSEIELASAFLEAGTGANGVEAMQPEELTEAIQSFISGTSTIIEDAKAQNSNEEQEENWRKMREAFEVLFNVFDEYKSGVDSIKCKKMSKSEMSLTGGQGYVTSNDTPDCLQSRLRILEAIWNVGFKLQLDQISQNYKISPQLFMKIGTQSTHGTIYPFQQIISNINIDRISMKLQHYREHSRKLRTIYVHGNVAGSTETARLLIKVGKEGERPWSLEYEQKPSQESP